MSTYVLCHFKGPGTKLVMSIDGEEKFSTTSNRYTLLTRIFLKQAVVYQAYYGTTMAIVCS